MNYVDAAIASDFSLSIIEIKKDRHELYDNDSRGFMIAILFKNKWTVSRKKGRGSAQRGDWEPCKSNSINTAYEMFKAEQEDRDIVIKKKWEVAVNHSEVSKAYRTDKNGRMMLRDIHRNTWLMSTDSLLTRVAGPFKHYDEWEPLSANSPFAEIDLNGQQTIRIDPITKEVKERSKSEYVQRMIAKEDVKVPVKKKKVKLPNPDAPNASVSDAAIAVSGQVAAALAAAIPHTEGNDKAELISSLKYIGKSVSWLLKEDRHKWERKP